MNQAAGRGLTAIVSHQKTCVPNPWAHPPCDRWGGPFCSGCNKTSGQKHQTTTPIFFLTKRNSESSSVVIFSAFFLYNKVSCVSWYSVLVTLMVLNITHISKICTFGKHMDEISPLPLMVEQLYKLKKKIINSGKCIPSIFYFLAFLAGFLLLR